MGKVESGQTIKSSISSLLCCKCLGRTVGKATRPLQQRHIVFSPDLYADLPCGWESAWDPTYRHVYYFNRQTGERSWERPEQEELDLDDTICWTPMARRPTARSAKRDGGGGELRPSVGSRPDSAVPPGQTASSQEGKERETAARKATASEPEICEKDALTHSTSAVKSPSPAALTVPRSATASRGGHQSSPSAQSSTVRSPRSPASRESPAVQHPQPQQPLSQPQTRWQGQAPQELPQESECGGQDTPLAALPRSIEPGVPATPRLQGLASGGGRGNGLQVKMTESERFRLEVLDSEYPHDLQAPPIITALNVELRKSSKSRRVKMWVESRAASNMGALDSSRSSPSSCSGLSGSHGGGASSCTTCAPALAVEPHSSTNSVTRVQCIDLTQGLQSEAPARLPSKTLAIVPTTQDSSEALTSRTDCSCEGSSLQHSCWWNTDSLASQSARSLPDSARQLQLQLQGSLPEACGREDKDNQARLLLAPEPSGNGSGSGTDEPRGDHDQDGSRKEGEPRNPMARADSAADRDATQEAAQRSFEVEEPAEAVLAAETAAEPGRSASPQPSQGFSQPQLQPQPQPQPQSQSQSQSQSSLQTKTGDSSSGKGSEAYTPQPDKVSCDVLQDSSAHARGRSPCSPAREASLPDVLAGGAVHSDDGSTPETSQDDGSGSVSNSSFASTPLGPAAPLRPKPAPNAAMLIKGFECLRRERDPSTPPSPSPLPVASGPLRGWATLGGAHWRRPSSMPARKRSRPASPAALTGRSSHPPQLEHQKHSLARGRTPSSSSGPAAALASLLTLAPPAATVATALDSDLDPKLNPGEGEAEGEGAGFSLEPSSGSASTGNPGCILQATASDPSSPHLDLDSAMPTIERSTLDSAAPVLEAGTDVATGRPGTSSARAGAGAGAGAGAEVVSDAVETTSSASSRPATAPATAEVSAPNPAAPSTGAPETGEEPLLLRCQTQPPPSASCLDPDPLQTVPQVEAVGSPGEVGSGTSSSFRSLANSSSSSGSTGPGLDDRGNLQEGSGSVRSTGAETSCLSFDTAVEGCTSPGPAPSELLCSPPAGVPMPRPPGVAAPELRRVRATAPGASSAFSRTDGRGRPEPQESGMDCPGGQSQLALCPCPAACAGHPSVAKAQEPPGTWNCPVDGTTGTAAGTGKGPGKAASKGKGKGSPPQEKGKGPGKGQAPEKGAPEKGKGGPPGKGPPGGKGKSKAEPLKPEVTPRIPLKKLFWNRLSLAEGASGASPQETVWKQIHREGANFDASELEELFAEMPPELLMGAGWGPSEDRLSTRGDEAAGDRTPGGPRHSLRNAARRRRVLEEKRRRQLWFMLALMPELETLLAAVARMDREVLNPESIELLVQNLPTAEERQFMARAASDATSEEDLWDTPEDFVLRITAIAEYELRLQVWSFLNSFDVVCSKLTAAAEDVAGACDLLRGSERIKQLLALVLFVGNYLNGGTPRGRADGFDVETLPKLSAVKASLPLRQGASRSSATLLDFLVRQMERDHPGVLPLMYQAGQEVDAVHRARRHKLTEIREELGRLQGQAESYHCRLEQDVSEADPLGACTGDMRACVQRLAVLNSSLEEVNSKYQALGLWFQMDLQKLRPTDEFFGLWDTFFADLKRALEVATRPARPGPGARSTTPRLRTTAEPPTPGPGARERDWTPPRRSAPALFAAPCSTAV